MQNGNGRRPIRKVYRAFLKAGRGKEAGTVKEAFLGQLQANGVDLAKTSSFRLALVLQGDWGIEDLKRFYSA